MLLKILEDFEVVPEEPEQVEESPFSCGEKDQSTETEGESHQWTGHESR